MQKPGGSTAAGTALAPAGRSQKAVTGGTSGAGASGATTSGASAGGRSGDGMSTAAGASGAASRGDGASDGGAVSGLASAEITGGCEADEVHASAAPATI